MSDVARVRSELTARIRCALASPDSYPDVWLAHEERPIVIEVLLGVLDEMACGPQRELFSTREAQHEAVA